LKLEQKVVLFPRVTLAVGAVHAHLNLSDVFEQEVNVSSLLVIFYLSQDLDLLAVAIDFRLENLNSFNSLLLA